MVHDEHAAGGVLWQLVVGLSVRLPESRRVLFLLLSRVPRVMMRPCPGVSWLNTYVGSPIFAVVRLLGMAWWRLFC